MSESNLKQSTQDNLQGEITQFINTQKSLILSSIDPQGNPYASYAPFGIGDECLYVLLSDIALHAVNLKLNPTPSVMIIQDESAADELFARIRVVYRIEATEIEHTAGAAYEEGIKVLSDRHGQRINELSKLSDFHLFKLQPVSGRFVKGFGRAYDFVGKSLNGNTISHLRDGHVTRPAA
ncbi:MAG: pyridoxamine 5'-phosphate oxidase family protein [Cellvibrionales bacterium]|jgi:putative heme iron utilization protein|nr:pyridoxamine 5'-phosphate oxidase family protein [Cellvibrionales bacterium]MBK8675445.1 pyridoxamine 5'-phosphate oxidase family protein [Cellvibrionales bacterium]HRF88512.1 pyridoxamine 5'-phosphate oxidase family protein [Pseudomonadales bacterium]HRG49862.1 pyridoxamine 5'-phosphate oxidase family protein [Pseudomonadales bacterium]